MSYGTNDRSNKKLLGFKIVDKAIGEDGKETKVSPYFEVTEKNLETGKYEVVAGSNPKYVSGNLTTVKLGSFKYKDDDINTVKVYLEDGDEIYSVDLRYSNLGRSIFNRLIALETYENVKISVYTNRGGFTTAGVEQNGERVNWKFEPSDLPAIPKLGKKQVPDSTEIDEFFLKELTELVAKVDAAPKIESAPRTANLDSANEELASVASGDEPNDDDIPF